MFRSQEMQYVQILLPAAIGEDFADRMGREGCMQFTDLNEDFQPFQRTYTSDIIKIQEIERQIKLLEELLNQYQIKFDSEVDAKQLQEDLRPNNASQLVDGLLNKLENHIKDYKNNHLLKNN